GSTGPGTRRSCDCWRGFSPIPGRDVSNSATDVLRPRGPHDPSLSLSRATHTRDGSDRTRPPFSTSTWGAASKCRSDGAGRPIAAWASRPGPDVPHDVRVWQKPGPAPDLDGLEVVPPWKRLAARAAATAFSGRPGAFVCP